MKLLILVTQFHQPGGAERLGVELAEGLAQSGLSVCLASLYREDTLVAAGVEERMKDAGVDLRYLGLDVHPGPWGSMRAAFRLASIVRNEGFDVVETSSMSSTVLACWATKLCHFAHVVGVHQVFRRDRENSWRHRVWRWSLKTTPGIRFYGISDFVSRAWCEYLPVSKDRVDTIYNAVSDAVFETTPAAEKLDQLISRPDDRRVVIYIGRLAQYKGCDVLLDAMLPLLEPDNLQLVLVGEVDDSVAGSRDMVEKMKLKVSDKGLEGRVTFAGYRADAVELLAAADLMVHPTYMEGFGLGLLEALAVGTPVVATKVEAVPEILAHSGSLLVAPGDRNALREAAKKALGRSVIESKEVQEKGRMVAEKYRQRNRCEQMIELFYRVAVKAKE